MSLLNAIKRAKELTPEPFIAPVLDANRTDILVVQDNIPIWVRIPIAEPGWFRFIIFERRGWVGRAERLAYPGEYLSYLDQLPRFYVIALVRLAEMTWLVTPFNAADAQQRGWPAGQPMTMHLVRESVRQFSIVDARQLGGNLLYSQMPLRGNIEPGDRDRRRALDIARQYDEVLREKHAREEAEQKLTTVEGQIRDHIEFAGGNLLAWQEVGEEFEVTWEWGGNRLRTRVGREMNVRSVGFCTAGTTRQHSLTSIVALLQEGIKRNHYAVQNLDDRADYEEEDEW